MNFSILRIADDIKIVKEQQFSLCFCTFSDIIINFVSEINIFAIDALNRIKVVLVEQKKTGKWLSEQLGVNVATTSRWCSNVTQPDLQTLDKIAELLEVEIRELFVSEYKQYLLSQELK